MMRIEFIRSVGLCLMLVAISARAQNTFPANGNVGIGTTNPAGQLANNPINYGEFGSGGSAGSFNWVHTAVDSGWSNISSAGVNGLVVATDQTSGVTFQVSSGVYNLNTGFRANHLFSVLGSGSVGIGTSTPGAKLEVAGNVKLTSGSGASITYQDGSVQTTAWNGVLGGGDYAESVDVIGKRNQYEPGDVLVIDATTPGKFIKSATPYSTAVAGIYSTKPGVRGRRQETDSSHMSEEVPMAMVGVVPTKVSTEGGPIMLGDLLVTSSKPGYAMKGSDRGQLPGAIVGKAMGNLESGEGIVEVLVSLQ